MMMERILKTIQGLKPVMMMVLTQAAFAGWNISIKLAANVGMSMKVFTAYRLIFAAAFTIPLALIVERKSRTKLSWVVVSQAFLCGLVGESLPANLYAESLVLTSATVVAAMVNLGPVITFILAFSLGMERLGFGTWAGKAKLVGISVSAGGAMLLTFYEGAEINIWSTSVDLLRPNHDGHVAAPHQKAANPVWGAFLSLCSCVSVAAGFIIQAWMMRDYPYPYSTTAMIITSGAFQAVGFALCTEKDWSQWKLGWDIRLLIVSYSGIVACGLVFIFIAWCVKMRGPLFVSVFNPLMLVLTAISGSLVLDEKLRLGTVLGSVLIICGLYTVLWGKAEELKTITQLRSSKSSRESEPIEVVINSSEEQENDETVEEDGNYDVHDRKGDTQRLRRKSNHFSASA